MLPSFVMHTIRISIIVLWTSAIANARQSEQATDATSKSTVTKSSSKSAKSQKSKTTPSKSDSSEQTQDDTTRTSGIELSAPRKMEMQFGMRFLSNDNYCTNLYATFPFPMNWPEQKVTELSTEIPTGGVLVRRDLPIGSKQNALARQLLVNIASLGPNSQLELLVNVEIEKSFIEAPSDTSVFVIPNSKKLGNELRFFVGRGSPYIDHEHREVQRVAKQIAADNPENAWAHVERIYDWVRENIEYRKGKIRHMREALKDKKGDCEEMTGLFVALCRASNIPARCVWVPGHAYPEFYLEDPQGEGHWFPCQVAGERQFGQMHDYRPILQKGDRFKVPEETATLRYVAEYFTCNQRPSRPQGLNPSVVPILDLGPLQAELSVLSQQNASQVPPSNADPK